MSIATVRPAPVRLEIFVCNHFAVGERFVSSTVHLTYDKALLHAVEYCRAFMENLTMLKHEREYLLRFYAAKVYGEFLKAYTTFTGDSFRIVATELVIE